MMEKDKDQIFLMIEIFSCLRNKNVWYYTGTELAEYYYLRKNIRLIEEKNGFYFVFSKVTKKIENMDITLLFDKKYSKIILPNKVEVEIKNDVAIFKTIEGEYIVR